ncbi:MAG: tetratricopeptide repeat protein [Deltaproteobacteria bacterium]|nr:tetratricopeptide repeat protein [Deltaproteobacteria bacterium]MBM4322453.1 tetratricopeptide repeat protein [Deltaproteobacteria bacterium]MBM4347087.1 tetratricopeptide repeat protein [Deltaproteobacteria bacterium]
MERKKYMLRDRSLLEVVQGLLHSQVVFQDIFKKYRKGKLCFADIENWVDDRGQSPLYNLKEQSHSLFRNKGKEPFHKNESLLDLVIGSIFHEAIKLRENIYQLEIYRPKYLNYRLHAGKSSYERDYSQRFERIIAKAEQGVLLGISEMRSLFQDAMEQLIDLFKQNLKNPYLVRFLLEHHSLLKKIYGPQRGKAIFSLIFERGLQEAYDRAGRSYLLSGHYDLSSHYFSKALKLDPSHPELRFLVYFSLGMNAYYNNIYVKTLSLWRNLISLKVKKNFKKRYVKQLEEVCRKVASELNEEGKHHLSQKAQSLADQIKKMLG